MLRKLIAFAFVAAGVIAYRPGADAQSEYQVSHAGDVVTLSDKRTGIAVRVLTTASNAYQMTAKGEDVIRKTWNTLDDIRARMGLNGVPLLWPYANRLEEQAFYANGRSIPSTPASATPAPTPFRSTAFSPTRMRGSSWKRSRMRHRPGSP